MKLTGSIDEVRFRNNDNGYTICVLDVDGDPVICVGTFPPVLEGENVEVSGSFIMHPKFGRQFKADKISNKMPDTEDGLIRYLGSGLIKGIGPKTALLIVNTFKDKTLEILENQPFLLSKIKGITKEKAKIIGEEFNSLKNLRESVTFLQSYNITANLAVKIYKAYGDRTVSVVKSNPYKLMDDIDGIGFITADKIAAELGIEKDSAFRIRAGIAYSLMLSGEKNGNTFLPLEILKSESAGLLNLDESLIEAQIEHMIIESKLKKIPAKVGNEDILAIMLSSAYRAEKSAATKLVKLKETANKIFIDCCQNIAEYERSENISLHETQKEAVETAVNNGVSVITGGPGTGKTTIIKCILAILSHAKLKYELMAPTGRAAKRLSESTGENAKTIHRALMLMPGVFTQGEMLESDVVIVDEFSMVDIYLFNSLMQRLREGTKLILIGDKNQLPSVGAGNVLADIIESGFIETINLTHIYRQGSESLITINAHAINNGKMPELSNNTSDFFFTKATTVSDIADTTCDLAAERIPKFLKCDPSKVQVLSPVKNGLAGTNNLNLRLQARLNCAGSPEIISGEQKFKAGDRVMQTANNYNMEWRKVSGYLVENGEGVFNGDMGEITGIRSLSGEIDVLFEDGRQSTYTVENRNQLILAYAITVHKSQGSEFDAVIIPIVSGNYMIMTRNLLYTAITRAKKIVVLVGEEYNIKKMVDNNYIAKRYSLLKDLILLSSSKYDILFGEQADGQ